MIETIHAVAIAATQLPPVIQQSFFKSMAALITGLFDLPAALLERKAATTRAVTAAQTAVIEAGGKAAAQRFAADPERVERATVVLGQPLIGADPDLADRAATFSNNRLLREQKNRESVAAAAIDDLSKNPPTTDSDRTVDDDWLVAFARVSETRSDAEMRGYFAKILAGEIRRPGSFSQVTLDVASKLTTDLAELFQVFCNASSTTPLGEKVLAAPFRGTPGSNSLAEVGLPYSVLAQLQDALLIQGDLEACFVAPPKEIFTEPFELASVMYRATPMNPAEPHPMSLAQLRIATISFTRAGRELRKIVPMGPHPIVVERLASYLRGFDLELERVEPAN